MEPDARAKLKDWLATGKARLEPLSFPQRELWEASAVAPGDPSNNICCLLDIRGPLTEAMCRESLGHVLAHQEVMRASFLPGKERPLQVVKSEADPRLCYRVLPSSVRTDEAVLCEVQECFSQPLDLLRGPLYRIEMLKRGPDHHVLALAIHHSIADGWTVSNFVNDFTTGCLLAWQKSGNDTSRLKALRLDFAPLEMTCAQWAANERARWNPEALEKQAGYWRRRLEGARPFLRGRGPLQPLPLACRRTEIPAALAEPVRGLAKKSGATLFSVLLALFRVALFRWSGQEDVVVGTPVAGRTGQAVREAMGYFSGTVPLRGRLDPERPFDAMVAEIHRQSVDDFANAMPFAELAAAVGRGGGTHPVFDVRFAVQNYPAPGIDIPGIGSRLELVSSGTARFDIGCEMTEDGRKLELRWLHRPDALAGSDLADLDRIFRGVIGEAGRDPTTCPADLRI